MKIKILAALAGAVIITSGCVSTVSDTHTAAITWSKDNLSQRYERSVDQAYQASVAVMQNNGVLLTEYIPHDATNATRSLQGKANEKNVWIRVEAIDASSAKPLTEVTVQVRSKWGVSDVSLASELLTQVALQLAR